LVLLSNKEIVGGNMTGPTTQYEIYVNDATKDVLLVDDNGGVLGGITPMMGWYTPDAAKVYGYITELRHVSRQKDGSWYVVFESTVKDMHAIVAE